MATRLATAAVTCSSLPKTSSPGVPPVTIVDPLGVGVDRAGVDGDARSRRRRDDRGRRLERVVALEPGQLDDLLHQPGEPVALGEHPAGEPLDGLRVLARRRATASASSRIAPTGVFSSWLTLATKSRRTASTRRSRVRSSTRASTSREPSGATRAVTWRGGRAGRGISSSVSRIWPSRRTWRTSSASSSETSCGAAHQPEGVRRRGGLHAPRRRRRRRPRCCAAPRARWRRRRARRAPPARGRVRCWRSLTCHASTAPPATTAPMSAARNACVVGSTP